MKMKGSRQGLRTFVRSGREGLRHMALACPICFGASDAPMALGMNWGVLTLLGVTVVVLGSFATFFVRLVRRAELVGPAEAGPYKGIRVGPAAAGPYTGIRVGPGFNRPDTIAGESS